VAALTGLREATEQRTKREKRKEREKDERGIIPSPGNGKESAGLSSLSFFTDSRRTVVAVSVRAITIIIGS
jgi:hypothetical protein